MHSNIQNALSDIQKFANLDARDSDPSAHAKLLRAIDKLKLDIEKPEETAGRLNFQNVQNICIRIALEHDVYRNLTKRDGKPVSAADLAKECSIDELLLIRIMRVLTKIGVADETAPQSYAANKVTRYQTCDAAIGAIKHHFDLDMAMAGKLVEYMRGPGISQFPEPERSTEKSLFEYTFGTFNVFGLLETHAEQKKSFDDYMAGRPRSKNWFEMYPAKEKLLQGFNVDDPDAVLLVDVAGGVGHETVRFKEANPDMPGHLIVQDLPVTLSKIEALPHGIEKQHHDFFKPQPIRGARAYFLRDIMHNWSDAKCTAILTNIVDAMDAEYSVLLIDDYVIPDFDTPLRAAEMDILMFTHLSAMERTKEQWMRLFDAVGLRLEGIYPAGQGEECVLECRKIS